MLSRTAASPLRRFASSTTTAATSKIAKAEESKDRKKLNIAWEDGTSGSVPFAWLRDVANEAKPLIHVAELSMEVRPEAISVAKGGNELTIQWPPYDVANYSNKLLWDHLQTQPPGVPPANPKASVWSKGFVVPEVSNDLAAEARKLSAAWEEFGVVKIKAGHNLAEGDFIHLLGLSDLRLIGEAEKSLNKAYPMSTQHPEEDFLPRLHTLKCLRPGRGTVMVADGFHAAQQFQASHPELFEFAAGRGIAYAHSGHSATRPMFSLSGAEDRLAAVCFNNPLRNRDVLLPQRAQDLLYKSLKVFNSVAMATYVDVPMSEGDILVVDNARVLTGNASIAPMEDPKAAKPLFRLSTFGL